MDPFEPTSIKYVGLDCPCPNYITIQNKPTKSKTKGTNFDANEDDPDEYKMQK
jgi:hypothetical protein